MDDAATACHTCTAHRSSTRLGYPIAGPGGQGSHEVGDAVEARAERLRGSYRSQQRQLAINVSCTVTPVIGQTHANRPGAMSWLSAAAFLSRSREERVSVHGEGARVGFAGGVAEGVVGRPDLHLVEAGLLKHVLPARTGQPACDSTGPEVDV